MSEIRTRNLLAALGRAEGPRRLIYVEYNRGLWGLFGAVIDETRLVHPESARAQRRVDAETVLRAWGSKHGVQVAILRAPGIYADDRLPVERLKKACLPSRQRMMFILITSTQMIWRRLVGQLSGIQGIIASNVVDDSDLKMAEYFDRVAAAFDLPPPPRITRQTAGQMLSPMQLSFMRESRRIGNLRIKKNLNCVLLTHRLMMVLLRPYQGENCACRKSAAYIISGGLVCGAVYLPRIFVNLAMVQPDSTAERDRLLLMAKKLYRFMTPLGILAVSLGLWLWLGFGFSGGWLHAKTLLVCFDCLSLALWSFVKEFEQAVIPNAMFGSASIMRCRYWSCLP